MEFSWFHHNSIRDKKNIYAQSTLRFCRKPAWVSPARKTTHGVWCHQQPLSTSGPWPGRLVPSSHQRSELSNSILGIFNRGDNIRVWKCIQIPNGRGGGGRGKATLINICISNGDLKCGRMTIHAASNRGDKVVCWYTGFTLQIFV